MAGVYVHIPFCKKKCLYCDFYSVGASLARWQRFIDCILKEAENRREEIKDALSDSPLSFYIGGGTPSLIPGNEFKRLASGLIDIFGKPVEFTIEVNPDDVILEKVNYWSEAGISRVSMGVQSMIDTELACMTRRHNSVDVRTAFALLRKAGFSNISLDLMFGLPGQSLDSLDYSIKEIIALTPEHISVYSLMYEERSALTRLRNAGKIDELPEEDSVKMFQLISKKLSESGYERYEISNYSQPGFRSVHNSSYWSGIPYLGFGPGAHSFDGKSLRRANIPNFKLYMESIENGTNAFEIETLDEEELREEMIMTRLRTIEGLNLKEYGLRFGPEAEIRICKKAQGWIDHNYLQLSEADALYLTDNGIMISDEIIVSLF